LSMDAGLIKPGSIGDRAWIDTNKDGIQTADENGLAGITVKLLDANNNILATKNTDVNGIYSFQNILPGSYMVEFVAPSNYTITQSISGSNQAVDSNPSPGNGRTQIIELSSGELYPFR